MIIRLTVNLEKDERAALLWLAECEKRDPRQQAAMIIRQRLEQLGLLQPTKQEARREPSPN